MSIFLLFGEKFWKRYVFALCDEKDLLTLLQTSSHLYKQKKYLYKLIYQKVWFNMTSFHHSYPINNESINHKFYNYLILINNNNTLKECFLKHKILSNDPTLKTIKYLFNKYLNIMNPEIISTILDFIIKIFETEYSYIKKRYLSYSINNTNYLVKEDDTLHQLICLF